MFFSCCAGGKSHWGLVSLVFFFFFFSLSLFHGHCSSLKYLLDSLFFCFLVVLLPSCFMWVGLGDTFSSPAHDPHCDDETLHEHWYPCDGFCVLREIIGHSRRPFVPEKGQSTLHIQVLSYGGALHPIRRPKFVTVPPNSHVALGQMTPSYAWGSFSRLSNIDLVRDGRQNLHVQHRLHRLFACVYLVTPSTRHFCRGERVGKKGI